MNEEVDFLKTESNEGRPIYQAVSDRAKEIQDTMVSMCYEGWFIASNMEKRFPDYAFKKVPSSILPPSRSDRNGSRRRDYKPAPPDPTRRSRTKACSIIIRA